MKLEALSFFYNNRALAHFNVCKYDEAQEDLEKAISFNPDDAEVYFNMGNVNIV